MLAILSYPVRVEGALPSSITASHVNFTSAEVNGVPSDQKRQSFNFQVIVKPSAETPPLSAVGISAASSGMKLFLSSHSARPGSVNWVTQVAKDIWLK